jgi:S-adenosylmethionine/arginine decarboxylase-like enzyme
MLRGGPLEHDICWRRVNDDPFEYAIKQGPHGDEFIKTPGGDCLKRPTPAKPFGYLLTLDLYGCKPGAADDLTLCYNFLESLVKELAMTMQSPPFIFRSPDAFPDKAGLSGWVPLIESGIQIHTLIPKNFISIDIYCCREFDRDQVVAFARKTFHPAEIESMKLLRGVKYHHEAT